MERGWRLDFGMKAILLLLFEWLFSLKISHKDRLTFDGPTVIMPNHVSFLDAIQSPAIK